MPTLVREILDNSNEIELETIMETSSNGKEEAIRGTTKWSLKQNLKGFAVGDGCMGTKNVCGPQGPGPLYDLEFFHGHGQFSDKLYYEVFHQCCMDDLIGFRTEGDSNFDGPNRGIKNETCLAHLKKIEAATGPFFAYGLYDNCWYQNDLEPPHNSLTQTRKYFSHVPSSLPPKGLGQSEAYVSSNDLVEGALNDYACGGYQALFDWVMKPQVKQALHVAANANFFSGDNGIGFTYNPSEPDLMPFYQRAVQETNLRVLVYNGDTDPAINSFTAQNWTSHLGIPETEPWRPWTIDGKQYIGGYVTRYENDFDYLTIRGAGT